jgi:hypothetical protein
MEILFENFSNRKKKIPNLKLMKSPKNQYQVMICHHHHQKIKVNLNFYLYLIYLILFISCLKNSPRKR